MHRIPPRASRALAFVFFVLPMLGWAQSPTVTGSFDGTIFGNAREKVTFTCTGSPTCTGQYTEDYKIPECSNSLVNGGAITITGLNLSGSMSGQITMSNWDYGIQFRTDGGCDIIAPITPATFPYTGSYNAGSGTGTMRMNIDGTDVPGTFRSDVGLPQPPFQMTVKSNIGAVTATASADIQFRPQDVGTSGSVFVFAVAPASVVKNGYAPEAMKVGLARDHLKAYEKADACVISQLGASGQLTAVSSAQLQAYLSGTLSSSGASVSILNGTPTPNVAGATFYVGYGTSAQTMLNDGIFRNAVQVPGNSICPMLPYTTALWWNPSESGWGLNLNHQGNTLFGTLFTYDAGRAPSWFVMSAGIMQADGLTYTGDLYRTTGPAFNAVPFTPIGAANVTRVGTMSITFPEAEYGTLRYTVNGVEVVKTIQRQVYGSRGANCLPTSDSRTVATNYQDLWWNAAESGWGLNVTHQDNTLFATLFTYDPAGRDLWLVMSAGTRQSDGSYLGDLYRTSGPAFNSSPFSGVTAATVGTMRLRFTDGNTASLTYTYNGATVNKTIQRQVFSSPVSLCR